MELTMIIKTPEQQLVELFENNMGNRITPALANGMLEMIVKIVTAAQSAERQNNERVQRECSNRNEMAKSE